MPRKKSKKQIELEERANFVPYLSDPGEEFDYNLYHIAPKAAIRLSKKKIEFSDLTLEDYKPLYELALFFERLEKNKNSPEV